MRRNSKSSIEFSRALRRSSDFQGIVDLVGAKFHEIFGPPTMVISLYDAQANRVDHQYIVERGVRFPAESESPPDPLRRKSFARAAPS